MATFDYADARATAEELIAEFGQTGAIRRTVASGSEHNPTLTLTDYPATLVDLDFTDREIDGTLVRSSDRKVYVSTEGLSIAPTQQDKVVIEGTEYEIVRVKPLSPAGVVVYWELQARG